MKKLILSFGILAFAVCFSFAQLAAPQTLTNSGVNGGSLILDAVALNTQGSDFVLKSAISSGGLARTRIQIAPNTGDTRAFIEALNSPDVANTGLARLGIRGDYAILGVGNFGAPTSPVKNFAIELDVIGAETGEAFVVTTGGFNVVGTPTVLIKVDETGKTETTEVQVKATVTPPDYVFEADYGLRSLEEVEQYITKNKHLPEIPSAADFMKDGINLGNMSFDLLKKVEELTLYMIDLKKENENLVKRIQILEKDNK